MDLNEIVVFAKVVQAGSFVGAARELRIPKSTVSRKVLELEDRLGVRLLNRTTRKLGLTDIGQVYFNHAARIVAEVEEAELSVGRMQDAPRGLLRVTTPLNFGFLGPIVAAFMSRFPEVRVEVVCSDRVVDLIDDGFDAAVRAGRLADSSLIARPIGVFASYLVATPDYLRGNGTPKAPEDLRRMDCLAFGAGFGGSTWTLESQGKAVAVDVTARMLANDFDLLRQAAVEGLGIAMLPVHRCIEDLQANRLQRVLPQWAGPALPIHAVYPSTRHLTPKVREFVDHLRRTMTPPPWEVVQPM